MAAAGVAAAQSTAGFPVVTHHIPLAAIRFPSFQGPCNPLDTYQNMYAVRGQSPTA
jgi:hypothetical protein